MKNIVAVAFAFVSFPAFGVVVKECPKTIQISVGKISTMSDAQVEKEVPEFSSPSLKQALEARDALRDTDVADLENLNFRLVRQTKSQCGYALKGVSVENSQWEKETRLFTRSGRDVLRVSLMLNGQTFWFYANVAEYSPEGLQTSMKEYSQVLGAMDREYSQPVYTVGFVSDVEIE